MGRLTDERPRLQTGPEFGCPALSGGLRKRSHGGNEIPTRNRKSGLGNPPPTAGASEFYPNHLAPVARPVRRYTFGPTSRKATGDMETASLGCGHPRH